MTEKALYRIANRQQLIDCFRDCQGIGYNQPYFIEVRPLTRSLEQNSRLWAMLGEVSKQVNWHGNKLSPEDWKHVFSAALSQQRVVPNIDGNGFVVLGKSTSKMSIREMTDLIELIFAFGAQHGVVFSGQ